jgi:hypothetical protein
MIPFEDYIEHAPTEVGEQVAIDHVNCPAGTDMRGRLYIKRASEELVLAYCHNCADKGYYICGYSNVASYRNKEGNAAAPVPKGIRMPSGLDRGFTLWPIEARKWSTQYLTRDDVLYMGMYYWPTKRRVLIPFTSIDYGGITGYQTRKVFPDDPYPKYLTQLDWSHGDASKFYVPYTFPELLEREPKGIIVICEDMISAYKLWVAGYDPYCLCGGHFDINEFYRDQQRLLPDTKKITVWLDNDNREIEQLARRIKQCLRLTYTQIPVTRVGNAWKDPKACPDFTKVITTP